ncbi:hypothetical protein EDB86DRAFT_3239487 [Lactarius hatsudake]|nr:hypothetical protein EDB86DRAFT_3239487 [Lactarius hatsudake]
MQAAALRITSVISAGAAFGRHTLLRQRQRIYTRTTRRAIAPSTASLSTVPTSEATRRSSDDDIIYVGPLTQTFRRLKIFSLSSLALAGSLSPFIFLVESSLPSTARVALAATALATSGVSTALVAWCGKPYVTTLRRLSSTAPTAPQQQQQHTTHSHNENAPAGIELTTLTLALTPRATRVYDPAFLGDATRAFARWELARSVQLPPEDAAAVRPGEEETVAETLDSAGKVLGRWIVTWGENGEGSCRAEGRVQTHFNVHEELLTTPVR